MQTEKQRFGSQPIQALIYFGTECMLAARDQNCTCYVAILKVVGDGRVSEYIMGLPAFQVVPNASLTF